MKTRLCKFCEKEFVPRSNRQCYCKGPHYRKCPVCGKEYLEDNVDNLKKPPVACSYECRTKLRTKTSLERYGIKAPGNNPEARKKASQTMIKHLGVPYAMQSKEVQQKSKSTLHEKYGVDNAGKSKEVIEKRKKTNKERYGDVLPFNRPESYAKQHKTMMERYGFPYFVITPEFSESSKHNRISKINLQFSELLKQHNIMHELELRIDYDRGFKIYDFYLPESNTLIEINPTFTHTYAPTYLNPKGYDKYYHRDKTNVARQKGYRCVNIWDWDDYQSLIDIVSTPIVKIYARQCRLFKLHSEVGKKFIQKYDINSECKGQMLYLGLVYQGDLVQVMSFRKAKTKYDIELSHLCTKARYQVVGGASKLFDFATNGFDLYNIVAYNDLSKFTGDVFEKIGMKLDHVNPPQLMWSKDKKYFADSTLWIYRKKKEDMINESYLPIYNCGSSVYIYV